jgi:hypothetical protein
MAGSFVAPKDQTGMGNVFRTSSPEHINPVLSFAPLLYYILHFLWKSESLPAPYMTPLLASLVNNNDWSQIRANPAQELFPVIPRWEAKILLPNEGFWNCAWGCLCVWCAAARVYKPAFLSPLFYFVTLHFFAKSQKYTRRSIYVSAFSCSKNTTSKVQCPGVFRALKSIRKPIHV